MATLSQTQAHACEWRERAEALEGENAALKARLGGIEHQLVNIQRAVFGRRSEKLPRIDDELRKGESPSPEVTQKKRRERRAARADIPERVLVHEVQSEKRHCPKCGSRELRPLGEGKKTVVYEYIPARVERQIHVQETLACRCGEGVVTADVPKAVEKGQYGPGFIAHVVTAKCCDSIPLYRQAKALARTGVPVARTTLGDLFHQAAAAMDPLYNRLLELIRQDKYVSADETPQRVLAKGKTRRGYVWTFRTPKLVGYVHSHGRSGDTATKVLGGTQGYLQVDAYSGYNSVTVPDGRVRVGCWAHVRRKFFEALATAPEAQQLLDLIVELYRVERTARDTGTAGSENHLALRKQESVPTLRAIQSWMAAELPKHPPKTPIAEAIRYAQGQWNALTRFVDDAQLALDNNASERALRTVALGRKNYLFVGTDEAGENLAALTSLLATCEANDVNPEAYLADVLLRLSSHPASKLDELLPHLWTPDGTATDSS